MERYSEYKDSGIEELGKVPSHWRVGMLRSYLTIFSEKGYPNETLLSVTRELGVIKRNKESKEENHNFIPDDLSGYKLVHKGDFVINKMKSWQGSYGVSQHQGIVSPAYYTCKLDNVDREFFSRAIRSRAYIGFFASRSKGIRVGQWDLPVEALKQIPFIVPPLPEQKSIVAYLDTQTSRIDSFISDVECEIELLGEAKQKIIADAVTKGLKKDVEMRDSGVEWLGEIPAHWKKEQLRKYIKIVSIKNHPEKQLLSVTREQGVIVRNKESKEENHNFIPDDLSGYKYVQEGQFVINKMKSWQGSYDVSKYEGIVSPAYYVCDLRFPNKDFFRVALRSKAYIGFFTQYSKGIRVGQWDLDPIALKSIPFFEPPIEEQQEIVDYISQKTSQIDTLMSSLSQQITLLKEYKQRLISDVVTGQIKVC